MKKIRRLFDIQTAHVSLVDRGANNRTFLLVKMAEPARKTGRDFQLVIPPRLIQLLAKGIHNE